MIRFFKCQNTLTCGRNYSVIDVLTDKTCCPYCGSSETKFLYTAGVRAHVVYEKKLICMEIECSRCHNRWQYHRRENSSVTRVLCHKCHKWMLLPVDVPTATEKK